MSDGPQDLRCAYCHADLRGTAQPCAGCGTWLHAECWTLAAACPTLGCGAAGSPREGHKPPGERMAWSELPRSIAGLPINCAQVQETRRALHLTFQRSFGQAWGVIVLAAGDRSPAPPMHESDETELWEVEPGLWAWACYGP